MLLNLSKENKMIEFLCSYPEFLWLWFLITIIILGLPMLFAGYAAKIGRECYFKQDWFGSFL